MQLGHSGLSSHLLHHAPCPTLVIPYKSMSSEGSVPEGGLPVLSADGGAEMSPRDSLDTSAGAPGHRRNSVGAHSTFSMIQCPPPPPPPPPLFPLGLAKLWLCVPCSEFWCFNLPLPS